MRSQPTVTESATAELPAPGGGWWRFRLDAATTAHDAATVRSVVAAATRAPGWRILFVGFEGGLALAGWPIRHRPTTPLAAWWPAASPEHRTAPRWPRPLARWRPEWSSADHRAWLERVLAEIHAGEYYQLNLTFRLWTEGTDLDLGPAVPPPPRAVRLRTPELELVGWTPERFLALDAERRVVTSPIKGTAPTGDEAALVADPKEHAEHAMIVDMARNDLGRVAIPGSVRVRRWLDQLRLPYATHLESDIEARLRPEVDLEMLLAATLPAASISGTPKRRACAAIEELETSPRGPYTGILGWLAPDGRAYFSLLIRTLWHERGRWAYGTGGGIVADSDPEQEYAEAILKTTAVAGPPVP